MKDKIIFLDTETTDIEKEPGMIQLGYIICDLNLNEIKRENMFFDTEKGITFGSMAIHHITPDILITKLSEDERGDEEKIKQATLDFKNAYLVAHNSPFDKNVLDCNGIETPDDAWIDSYNIAYSRYTDDDMKHSLQFLRYYLGCTFNEVIDAHDAMSDVIVLKEVFYIMFGVYKNECDLAGYEVENNEHFDEMIEKTKKGIILRKWFFGKHKGESFEDTIKTDRNYFKWMYNEKKESGETKDAVFNTVRYYLNETRQGSK